MHVSVYLPFLLSALFGALMPALSRRLPPHHATWLLSVGAAVLAVTSAGCLTLLALTAAARVPPIAAAGDLSIAALTRHDPVHEPIALAAVGAVIVLAAVFARALVRRVLAIGQIYRSARELPGTQLVVVVDTADDAAAVACAVPGRVGRILVSRDLLTGLPPDQRAALLGHEWSHLAHRHYLHQAVVDVAATLNPFLRSLPAATRFTTERWADEDAAAATGDRAVLA
ncbi:MAG: M48 family metalloprotease, partial [Mycobacteriales bacterium]